MSIKIETERLIVRTPIMDDLEGIHSAKVKFWRDLQLWLSWAYDGEETIEATRRFIENASAQNFLIGVCRESGKFILSTGINPTAGFEGRYETGYWVAKEFLGQGYATEGTAVVIRHAFNALVSQEIYICHYEGNEASRRIIEKLGFTKTGIREKAHKRCLDGVLLDVHDFLMTRDEWRRRCL
jgi:RimJ/RimL family protein N-acetyltransferase